MKKLVSIFFTVIAIIGLTACSMSEQVVVKPTYPHNTSFEDYDGQREIMDNNTVDESFTAPLKDFSYHSASKVLVSSQKNINYSPVSLYMTLALAGSGAEGATKAEIFSALGIDKIDKVYLSTQTGNLFRQLYSDNKVGKLKIANSLWLQKGNEFKSDFIEKAAKNSYSMVAGNDKKDYL